MRILILFLIYLSITNIFAQEQPTPIFYLNSDSVDMNDLYINPHNIAEININKETKRSRVDIKTKKIPNFLSLDTVLKKYTQLSETANPIVYSIDNKVVNNKANAKIDDTYFIYVEVKSLDKVNYLDDKYRNLIIVEITLSDKKIEPKISIKGQEYLK